MPRITTIRLLALLAGLAAAAGCAARPGVEETDRAVRRVISEKEAAVPGGDVGFDRPYEPYAPPEAPAELALDLPGALLLAARHSREYQAEKETLYLAALALLGERYQWDPRLETVRVSAGAERAAGRETVTVGSRVSLLQWLADGARVTLDLSADFFRYPRESLASAVSINVLQPLMRGAGRRIARENLTLAERQVVYRMRSFVRYQRRFSVSVATAWFGLLRQRMELENRENSYRRLELNLERAEMLGAAGRLPMLQVDQARQNELAARNRLVTARADYRDALDRFKVQLGLPVDVEVTLAEDAFERFAAARRPEPALDLEASGQFALRQRLDLLNAGDEIDDARRALELAGDNLRPRFDLSAMAASGRRYRAGLDLELPLDREPARHVYRRRQVELARREREYERGRDNVLLEVSSGWRALEQARQTHEIQAVSLALARRRVESVNLLLDAGRASQRDILDAEDDLLEAENGLARALISYYNAYLAFLRDIEQLPLGAEGLWTGGFTDGEHG